MSTRDIVVIIVGLVVVVVAGVMMVTTAQKDREARMTTNAPAQSLNIPFYIDVLRARIEATETDIQLLIIIEESLRGTQAASLLSTAIHVNKAHNIMLKNMLRDLEATQQK